MENKREVIPMNEMKAEDMKKATVKILIDGKATVFEDIESLMVLGCNRIEGEGKSRVHVCTHGPIGIRTMMSYFAGMRRAVGDKIFLEAYTFDSVQQLFEGMDGGKEDE